MIGAAVLAGVALFAPTKLEINPTKTPGVYEIVARYECTKHARRMCETPWSSNCITLFKPIAIVAQASAVAIRATPDAIVATMAEQAQRRCLQANNLL